MCNDCNEHKGVVFHCNKKECSIYNCCVTKNGFKNCSECREVPCEIWKKTRNPKFSDEEFAKNIKERIEILNSLYDYFPKYLNSIFRIDSLISFAKLSILLSS